MSDDAALKFLATQGWLPLVLADHPDLVEAYTALQKASAAFFALDETNSQKTTYRAASGEQASEEGYSQIPSEKCILTVKTASHCPEIILAPVKAAWDLTGAFMARILKTIALTLELEPDVFDPFVEPCQILPKDARTPTLLRMFRYYRPSGPEVRVNAEKHKDLGLLSLVVGHSPGLSVLDSRSGEWVSVEEDDVLPPGARVRSGGLTATLLVGQTLAFLSRGKYNAGAHSVVCAPPIKEPSGMTVEERFRYSLVFTLRPAAAPVWTKSFESGVTGLFSEREMLDGESSEKLFAKIKRVHYNVNAAPDIREQQRKNQHNERIMKQQKVFQ